MGYGYKSDDVALPNGNNFNFGLNAGTARLVKFELIQNGGKGGAEAEALDIIFTVGGANKNYRIFPITQAFLPNNGGVTTDPNSKEFKEAEEVVSQVVSHILHCFVSDEAYKAAIEAPGAVTNFKTFCQVAARLLPSNFAEVPLDIFLQYQYTLKSTQQRTYLEIPKNMGQGKWVTKAQNPTPGVDWKAFDVLPPTGDEKQDEEIKNVGLVYLAVDATGTPVSRVENVAGKDVTKYKKHPFMRTKKYMSGNFAKEQISSSNTSTNSFISSTSTSTNGGFGDLPFSAGPDVNTPPVGENW